MEFLIHGASVLSASAISSLIAAVWQGAVLASFVAICIRLLPRLSAAFRSVIWFNVFLILVLLHFVPAFKAQVGIGQSAHAMPILLSSGFSLAIAALWIALSLWRSAQLILSAVRLRQLVQRATPLHTDEALQALLCGDKISRCAMLCTSLEVERPSVIGFFHPRILIPPSLVEKLSPHELKQIILHEMEHLRRGDDWSNLLQKIGLALFPLNPVLYWAEGRLCAERELACDDRVVQSSCTRKAYAICLTRLAEDSLIRRKLSLALGAWDRRSELVSRVQRLLTPGRTMGGRQAAVVTGGLILAILGGALCLARSPQLVGFATVSPATSQASLMTTQSLRAGGAYESRLGDGTGSLHLVKAVMPQRPVQSAFKPKAVRGHAAKRSVKPRLIEDRQAWLVLTDWNDSMPPPHLVIAVDPADNNRYAAVPVAHGWLILQI